MTKQGGLGARFFVAGFDLSGDINALDQVGGGPAYWDGTDITQLAHARITGQRDGHMKFAAFMDVANAHPVLAAMPRGDVLMSFLVPPLALGSPVANLNAKQIDYDGSRSAAGDLMFKVQGEGNSFGLEWGIQLTPGLRTDTAATNGPTFDQGNGFVTPGVPANGVPVTNTTALNATVVVSAGTGTNVAINGVLQGTFDGTYQVPSGGTITLTYTVAPTWTWTLQTLFGAQAYMQVTAFAGTSATMTVQHAPDGSTWTTLAAFTAVAAAPATQRVVVANNVTVQRYLRVITAGTFNPATFFVGLTRNVSAGVAF